MTAATTTRIQDNTPALLPLTNPIAPPPKKPELQARKELAVRLLDEDHLQTNGKLDPSMMKLFDRSNIDIRSAPELRSEIGSIRQSLNSSEGRRRDRPLNAKTDDVYDALSTTWNDQKIAELPLASRLLGGVLQPFTNVAPADVNWNKERDRLGLNEPAATTKNVQGCAQLLLDSKNVSYSEWLSSGSDRAAVEEIAKTGKSTVPVTGEQVTPNLGMMQALVEMARTGPVEITAITGGEHSEGSNHYSGTAVDLALGSRDTELEGIANRFGGVRNYETSHLHIDF